MKRIKTHIHTYKLDFIKKNLLNATIISINGIVNVTFSEIRTFENNNKETRTYRGNKYVVDHSTKIEIEIIVVDALVNAVIQELAVVLSKGGLSNDRIFISTIEEATV